MKKVRLPLSHPDRPLLATFHGRIPGKHEAYLDCAVRGNLVKSLKNLPGMDVGGFVGNYLELKGSAHFCLVPAGTSPWTNHLYESLFAGCVPVILSDEYWVAFRADLPWDEFSVKWPEAAVLPGREGHVVGVEKREAETSVGGGNEPEFESPSDPDQASTLYKYLMFLVQSGKVDALRKRGQELSCWFNWYSTDRSCSPFLLVLRRFKKLLQRRREDEAFSEGVPPQNFPDEEAFGEGADGSARSGKYELDFLTPAMLPSKNFSICAIVIPVPGCVCM